MPLPDARRRPPLAVVPPRPHVASPRVRRDPAPWRAWLLTALVAGAVAAYVVLNWGAVVPPLADLLRAVGV